MMNNSEPEKLSEFNFRDRKLTRWEKIYYPVYRFFKKLRWLHKDIYWLCQRHIRGYSDCDLWDVGSYLGEHILICLKAFRSQELCGIPCFDVDSNNMTPDKWEQILDDMIEGWEFILHAEDRILLGELHFQDMNETDNNKLTSFAEKFNNDIEHPLTRDEYNKLYPEMEKKAMLFVKYIHALWD